MAREQETSLFRVIQSVRALAILVADREVDGGAGAIGRTAVFVLDNRIESKLGRLLCRCVRGDWHPMQYCRRGRCNGPLGRGHTRDASRINVDFPKGALDPLEPDFMSERR